MTWHNECTIRHYNSELCEDWLEKFPMWEINTISPNCIISIPFLIDMNEVLSFLTWHEHERTLLKGLILHLTWNLLITFVDYFNRRPSIVQYDTQYPFHIQLESIHGIFLVLSFSISLCVMCLAYRFDTKHSIAIPSTNGKHFIVMSMLKTFEKLSFANICTGFECVLHVLHWAFDML